MKLTINNVPQQLKEEFNIQCSRHNAKLFRPALLALAIVEFMIILIQYTRYQSDLFTKIYFFIYVTVCIVSLLFSGFYYFKEKSKLEPIQPITDTLVTITILAAAIFMSVNELEGEFPQTTVFIVATFIIVTVVHLKLLLSQSLIILGNIILVVSTLFLDITESIFIGNLLNCLFLTIICCATNLTLYNSRVEKFIQKKELEKATTNLQIANMELEIQNKELESVAMTDALTGVLNRRSFDMLLHVLWHQALSAHSQIAMIFIDIDYFKLYNDYYGHLEGDECLKKISTTINSALRRSSDSVFRYGGEEFAVLLPGLDTESAKDIADTINQAVSDLNLFNHSTNSVVTCSCGIHSMIPDSSTKSDDLLARADKALYHAKQIGRNRSVCYDDI